MANWQLHIIATTPDGDENVVQEAEARMTDFIANLDRRLNVRSVLLTMDSGLVLTLVPGHEGPHFMECDEQLRPIA